MAGNLFSSLLSLHISPVPEEDFFTEIIAWLFDKDSEILFAWLKSFLGIAEKYESHSVRTQITFGKLENHLTDSRPDILISLFGEEQTDYIVIESKIGSYEGYEQLPRYAEQVSTKYPNARNRYLVYITREFDPKEARKITKMVEHDVIFLQLRWHQIYNFLKHQPHSVVLDEILAFMRSMHMAEITRITPASLAAISSFPDVYKFFETVLNGEVTDKFTKIVGKKPKSGADQFQYRRCVLSHYTNEWVLLVGFFMPESSEDFPRISVLLHVNPRDKVERGAALAQVYKQIEKDTASNGLSWKGWNLDDRSAWGHISLSCSLSEFLQEEDHVAALRKRLLEFLDDVKRIRKQYPSIMSGTPGGFDVQEIE